MCGKRAGHELQVVPRQRSIFPALEMMILIHAWAVKESLQDGTNIVHWQCRLKSTIPEYRDGATDFTRRRYEIRSEAARRVHVVPCRKHGSHAGHDESAPGIENRNGHR